MNAKSGRPSSIKITIKIEDGRPQFNEYIKIEDGRPQFIDVSKLRMVVLNSMNT